MKRFYPPWKGITHTGESQYSCSLAANSRNGAVHNLSNPDKSYCIPTNVLVNMLYSDRVGSSVEESELRACMGLRICDVT